jgi:hypothetical protein
MVKLLLWYTIPPNTNRINNNNNKIEKAKSYFPYLISYYLPWIENWFKACDMPWRNVWLVSLVNVSFEFSSFGLLYPGGEVSQILDKERKKAQASVAFISLAIYSQKSIVKH